MASFADSIPREKNSNGFLKFLKVFGIVLCSLLGIIIISVLGLYFIITNTLNNTLFDQSCPIIEASDTSVNWIPAENDLIPVLVDIRVTKEKTEYNIPLARNNDQDFFNDIKVTGRFLGLNGEIIEKDIEDFTIDFSEDTFTTAGKKNLRIYIIVEYLGLKVTAEANIPITVTSDGPSNSDSPFDSDTSKNSVQVEYDTSSLYENKEIYDDDSLEKIKEGYQQPIYKVDQKDENIFNILIITTDNNKVDPDAKRSNIGILTILSYNFNTSEATTFNLDEKMIGAYDGQFYTLNGIWAIGGPGALINSINNMLDLDIQRYIYMDPSSLLELVDTVGTVPITLTEEEINLLGLENVAPGNVLLDRNMALVYINLEGPDKTNRQQKFASAVLKKTFDGMSISDFSSFISKLSFATSNLSTEILIDLVFSKGIDVNNLQIDQFNAPFGEFGEDYSFVVSAKGNYAMLYTDLEKLKEEMYQYIGYSD